MKKVVIAEYTTKYSKLTLAKDEIRIKFREEALSAENELVVAFFLSVAKDLEHAEVTLRGKLKDGWIQMLDSKKKSHGSYKM